MPVDAAGLETRLSLGVKKPLELSPSSQFAAKARSLRSRSTSKKGRSEEWFCWRSERLRKAASRSWPPGVPGWPRRFGPLTLQGEEVTVF